MPVPGNGDPALEDLEQLATALDEAAVEAKRLAAVARKVLAQRMIAGHTWTELVERGLDGDIVAELRRLLDGVDVVGQRFRRSQAQAFSREGMSDGRIAAVFGVTRQRVSALLRDIR